MAAIPEAYHDLFERETFAHVATVMPDGTPHVTPVWVDHDPDAGHVLVNTERGRQKALNVERDPKVGLSVLDPDDPYRRLSVMGVVEEATTDGAREHIEQLSHRYTGGPYPGEIETERVLWRIRPERVF
ncbi:MAG: PPOX class F420-dependent oxidoreductase [Halobacteriales archaeon]|nr:PPOX class F420-dependent oxidoreductase [Halobacteriales archaeon]